MIVTALDQSEIFTEAFILKAINDKLNENHRLTRLQNYYEGKQDILFRQFTHDPSKPNNRIVVNYCKSITDFLGSYLVGIAPKIKAPQPVIDNLEYNDNAATVQAIVQSMNVMGFGAELFYNDDDGIVRFSSIDPREAIFIIDDTLEQKIVAFIRFYAIDDEAKGYKVILYFDTGYIEYSLSLSVGELKAVTPVIPHYFGDVPAILYMNNAEMLGTFEGVMSLQDALNKVMSDELNDFEQFCDSYLVLEGMQDTKAEDIAELKRQRVILLSPESKAYFLTKANDNARVAELKRSITENIRALGNIPDIENLGSLSSSVALRFKLINSEIQANKQERVLLKGLQRKYELIYNVLRMIDASIGVYTDVQTQFERNYIMLGDNEIQRIGMGVQLVSAGLQSHESFMIDTRRLTPEEAAAEMDKIGVID